MPRQYIGQGGTTENIEQAENIRGPAGEDGWTPILATVADGERRVHQIYNWIDGQGVRPTIGQYLGLAGLVDNIAEAVDIRGAQGLPGADSMVPGPEGPPGRDGADSTVPGPQGEPGGDGNHGWSPVLAVIEDGDRRVHQVIDWVGGSGDKPETGRYVGASGLLADISDGVDIRGPAGMDGSIGDTVLASGLWTPTVLTRRSVYSNGNAGPTPQVRNVTGHYLRVGAIVHAAFRFELRSFADPVSYAYFEFSLPVGPRGGRGRGVVSNPAVWIRDSVYVPFTPNNDRIAIQLSAGPGSNGQNFTGTSAILGLEPNVYAYHNVMVQYDVRTE